MTLTRATATFTILLALFFGVLIAAAGPTAPQKPQMPVIPPGKPAPFGMPPTPSLQKLPSGLVLPQLPVAANPAGARTPHFAPIANPIFQTPPNYPAGYTAQAIATGDFNGDGRPDFAVANYCQNNGSCPNGGVSVLLANTDGTYQAPISYSSGGMYSQNIAVADLNADGKLDIVVTNYYADPTNTTSSVGVLLGNGDGTFQPVSAYATGAFYSPTVAVGDFNGDGKPDLAIASQCQSNSNCVSGAVSVLVNNGDGTFQSAVVLASGGLYAFSVATGDFNGDGKLDLAVSNQCTSNSDCSTGSVVVLLGNGDGTFQPAVAFSSGGIDAFAVAAGDFNGDGSLDLVVSNYYADTSYSNGSVSVLRGNGDGTFQAPISTPSIVHNSRKITLGDINGDGKLDLAQTDGSGLVEVLLGNGDGSFHSTSLPVLTSGGTGLALVEVNADAKLDLAVVEQCQDNTCAVGAVILLFGKGDGTFTDNQSYASGGRNPLSVAVADLNGDGKDDVVLANECMTNNSCIGSASVFLGNGDGSFQPATTYPSAGWATISVAVGDVNGDGKPDLVLADDCQNLFCSPNNLGGVSVLLGNGDGTFQPATSFASGGVEAWKVALADLNGDGKLDVVVTNYYADTSFTTSSVGVLLGNGDGTFQPVVSYSALGDYEPDVSVGDLNGDGKLDLVVSNECQGNQNQGCTVQTGLVSVLLGNGDGSFQSATSYVSAGMYTSGVTLVDLNGDGKQDILLADQCQVGNCATGGISILAGNGDGTFQSAVGYPTSSQVSSFSRPVLADFDGDGKLDVAVTSPSGVNLLLGNGDGTLQASSFYLVAGNDYGLASGDFNRDHRPDLVFANNNQPGAMTILLNIANGFQASSTGLASSANPSMLGQSVTFTATVTSGAGTPTGTVTFYDGAAVLGSGTLSAGQASFSSSALTLGSHSITAAYGGDSTFLPSTSTILTQTVNQADTTTAVVSGLSPSAYNQSITFTATVSTATGTPTGSVSFYDGVNSLGSAPLSGGVAAMSTSSLSAGSHSITATYSGDTSFNGSTSSPLSQTVNQASSTTALSSSVNPSSFGQGLTLTATINPQFGGTATGSVTFSDGTNPLGTVTVSGNAAALTISTFSVGTHSITAVYNGDGNINGSTSNPVSQVVNKATTTAAVVSSSNPGFINQVITFTATVAGQFGGVPTGTVTFKNGTAILGTVALSGAKATLNKAFTSTGTKSITATYSGDGNFTTSTSGILSEVINKNPTTTALVTSVNPSVFGQAVTFTATVSASLGTPTGTVTFKNGTAGLGTVALSGGVAKFTTSTLSVGTKSITAVYNGSGSFATSISAVVSQVVNKATTTTALTSSLNPSNFGQAVTFTAVVSPQFAGTPTGSVTFKDGSATLKTVTLSGGAASFATTTLSTGSHNIFAVYNGSSSFTSSSKGLTQTVN